MVTTCWSHSSHNMGRGFGLGLPWLALGGGHPVHSHGPAGASPAWGALEGCRWCLWHPPVSRRALALSCMSSCMCWASGMSMHALTGTATSVSTGMRSSQVSPVLHRPGWTWESTEKGQWVWAKPQELSGYLEEVVCLPHHMLVSLGEGGVPLVSETSEVA